MDSQCLRLTFRANRQSLLKSCLPNTLDKLLLKLHSLYQIQKCLLQIVSIPLPPFGPPQWGGNRGGGGLSEKRVLEILVIDKRNDNAVYKQLKRL